ncbi:MAG: hypothetical protein ACR2RB_09625 [Gammaproteobacteria bacterium]
MTGAYVQALHYKAIPGSGADYDNAAPLEVETADFALTLADNQVLVTLKEGAYTDEQHARKVVDRYLRNWQIQMDLQFNGHSLSFEFDHADWHEDESKDGIVIRVTPATMACEAGTATIHQSFNQYPPQSSIKSLQRFPPCTVLIGHTTANLNG